MTNHWRDPKFKYNTSASHDDASAFRRRQRERRRVAQAAKAVTVTAIVSTINTRKRKAS